MCGIDRCQFPQQQQQQQQQPSGSIALSAEMQYSYGLCFVWCFPRHVQRRNSPVNVGYVVLHPVQGGKLVVGAWSTVVKAWSNGRPLQESLGAARGLLGVALCLILSTSHLCLAALPAASFWQCWHTVSFV
jgi:hypothetical protein